MNFFAHFLVAMIFAGAFVMYIKAEKNIALIFAITASVLLVLTGLCFSGELYLLCIIWSFVDLLLLGHMFFSKKMMNSISLVLVQIIFLILWGYLNFKI